MRERKNGEQAEGHEGQQESLPAAEHEVRAIEIRSAVQLATKHTQPPHRHRRPGLHEVQDQVGR